MQFLDMLNSPGLQHATEKMIDFAKEIRSLINHQGDQAFDCLIKRENEIIGEEKSNFDAALKCEYEWADNVYNKIIHDMKGYQHLSRIERPLQNETVYYPFNQPLVDEIKHAFMSASIVSEQIEMSCPDKRDYLFIQFQNPVITSFLNTEQPGDKDVVALIYSGDAELSKQCNKALKFLGGSVELGFRWVGTYNENKGVEFSGFSLKIIYPGNKYPLRQTMFNLIFHEFENTRFFTMLDDYRDHMLSMLPAHAERPRRSPLTRPCFFKPTRLSTIDTSRLNTVADYIAEHIPSVPALYIRLNELSINPAYQHTDQISQPLEINQKKIWLLRSDFILAVGNKNSNWTNFKDTELPDAIEMESHAFVNWEDRYGHPSLAIPHTGYDGSVFYGGYLAQRNGYIEIYTFSGRYHRHDLDDQKKAILEAYIAHHFQNAYGEQPVVFIDAVAFGPAVLDNFELSIFTSNNQLPDYCIRRTYDNRKIQSVFDSMNTPAVQDYPRAC